MPRARRHASRLHGHPLGHGILPLDARVTGDAFLGHFGFRVMDGFLIGTRLHAFPIRAASGLIQAYAKNLMNSVDRCTGERKYIISGLIKNIALRAKQLNMIVSGDEKTALLQLSVYVTSLVANYVHTGWYRGKDRKT